MLFRGNKLRGLKTFLQILALPFILLILRSSIANSSTASEAFQLGAGLAASVAAASFAVAVDAAAAVAQSVAGVFVQSVAGGYRIGEAVAFHVSFYDNSLSDRKYAVG